MVNFLETIDFDKKLSEDEAKSRAAEILRDNQFVQGLRLGEPGGGPVFGDDIARLRIIYLILEFQRVIE